MSSRQKKFVAHLSRRFLAINGSHGMSLFIERPLVSPLIRLRTDCTRHDMLEVPAYREALSYL